MLNCELFLFFPDNQSQLHRNCSELIPPAGLNISDNETWCDWVPFGTFCILNLSKIIDSVATNLEGGLFIFMIKQRKEADLDIRTARDEYLYKISVRCLRDK